MRPFIQIADDAVRALGNDLRGRHGQIYSGQQVDLDDASARLRVLDAWELRYLSAT